MDHSTLISLFSALLALIILIDISVLWLTGKQVPELLSQLVLAVFATYFASGLSRQRTGPPGSRPRRPTAEATSTEKEPS